MAGFFSFLRRVYLSIYNWTVCFGWFVLFISFNFSFNLLYIYQFSIKIGNLLHLFSGYLFFRAQVLYFAVKTLRESSHEHVYDAVEKPLQLAQTAAVLEVFPLFSLLN